MINGERQRQPLHFRIRNREYRRGQRYGNDYNEAFWKVNHMSDGNAKESVKKSLILFQNVNEHAYTAHSAKFGERNR